MMLLNTKVSEVFYSIEGEGPYSGFPTVFVKFFGCNLTCSGFEKNSNKVIPITHTLQSLDEFVAGAGCDSIYSWHPNYAHFAETHTVDSLYKKIEEQLGGADANLDKSKIVLSLTGGEPMLHQRFLADLFSDKRVGDFALVLIETNGTIQLLPELGELLQQANLEICWSVSPKLSNSGHTLDQTVNAQAIKSYIDFGPMYLKFVSDGSAKSFAEIEEVNALISEETGLEVAVYVMPEGSSNDQFHKDTARRVVAQCLQSGHSFCARINCYI